LKHLSFLLVSILITCAGFSQTTTTEDEPVYLRFPAIPQFTVYKAPDSTAFTRENLKKRTPVIFFYFSPDCSHCQHETESLIKNIKKFKNTQILMITHLPYSEMMAFYKEYKIANYPQITMARDTKYFFPVFFKVRNFPSIYVYDKNGNFKKAFEGSVNVVDIAEEL
jgi:cytochrome oxidase Cu insertion factor (SCO1/SenC/PrrC family)